MSRPPLSRQGRQAAALMGLVALCCAAMLVVDGVLRPIYPIKSAAKIVLFLLCPLLYGRLDGDFHPLALLRPKKGGFLPALGLGMGVFAVILAAYFVLRNVGNFSVITGLLEQNIGVGRDSFVYVAVYISFVNSLLEEFFFRGFAFFTLRRLIGRRWAYLFSAMAFAIYHTAMMLGWFSPALFALALTGLFVGGVLFDWLNERTGTIYPSWMVHMFANFAINAVGCMLFGIL